MLISDAHEWINEIPTVPIYYLAKPQPRERAWQNQRGKKTLNLYISTGSTVGVLLVFYLRCKRGGGAYISLVDIYIYICLPAEATLVTC